MIRNVGDQYLAGSKDQLAQQATDPSTPHGSLPVLHSRRESRQIGRFVGAKAKSPYRGLLGRNLAKKSLAVVRAGRFRMVMLGGMPSIEDLFIGLRHE